MPRIILAPMRADEPRIYKMQIEDKACTICVNVMGRTCRECGSDRKNWHNAFSSIEIEEGR